MGNPKDRDFVETVEGLLFCVVGYLHPPDRCTAYLKYLPDSDGKWSKGGVRYSRAFPYYHASQIEGTYGLLRERYPQYLFRCPVMNITVSSVPRNLIETYFDPKERLRAIMDEGAEDPLEQKLIDLVEHLCMVAGLRRDDFGVTGSILTHSHNPAFSDMDLTITGRTASEKLKKALIESKREGDVIQELSTGEMEDWSRKRSRQHDLGFDDLMFIAKRRWNYGVYRDTYFSVHPVRNDHEIREKYGDRHYRQRDAVKGSATIADRSESFFLPAIYKVDEVELKDERMVIDELVSYEGLFCDVFEEGERVEFRGVLEQVSNGDDDYRIVVGGSGPNTSYIRSLSS